MYYPERHSKILLNLGKMRGLLTWPSVFQTPKHPLKICSIVLKICQGTFAVNKVEKQTLDGPLRDSPGYTEIRLFPTN